jgi:hypothetical protein
LFWFSDETVDNKNSLHEQFTIVPLVTGIPVFGDFSQFCVETDEKVKLNRMSNIFKIILLQVYLESKIKIEQFEIGSNCFNSRNVLLKWRLP